MNRSFIALPLLALGVLLASCGDDSSGPASPTAAAFTMTPTTTAAASSTATSAPTPTRSPTQTDTPSPTATQTDTPSPTATQTASPTLSRAEACADLAELDLAETSITKVEEIPAGGSAPPGFFPAPGPLPAHCLVQGEIAPRVGVDGERYAIGFEVRLPEEWGGRFLFQGGTGTDGLAAPAVGPIALFATTAAPALARGYAVASTDGGHQGFFDPAFGLDPQARTDFFYNAIDRTTVTAKQIAERFYGRPPEHSYILGCSNGGRQTLVAVQRFPDHFDGAVAGNPAFNLSNAAIAEIWDTIAFNAIAPRDESGKPILSRALSDGDLTVLNDAVLRACDGNDGLGDGSIDDLESCDFDPGVVECAGEKTAACLSAEQVAAIRKVFGGPKNSSGEALYSDWPYDGGLASPGWRIWKLGTSPTSMPNALNVAIGFGAVPYILLTPPDPEFDPLDFDFDTDPARTTETGAQLNATSTDLSPFRGAGGKLLLYQGNSDAVFSANDLIRHYRRLGKDNGGAEAVQEWARLFLVPGMNHCGGGQALDNFDPLTAIENWVENGEAPERLVAIGTAFPGRSRPLCPYPKQPRYAGSGDTDDAASFECVAVGPSAD